MNEFEIMVGKIILGVVYLIVLGIMLLTKSEEYSVDFEQGEVNSHSRDLETKDVWLSIMWPLFFVYTVLKVIIVILNELLVILLLLIGYKYKQTQMYKDIYNIL